MKVPQPAARLGGAVRRRKTSQSAIIREPGHGDSFLDLAGDAVGSVAGPDDLSTGKRRLRGYGR